MAENARINPMGPAQQGLGGQIQTKPIKVLITTDDYEIEGCMHIKPGGYQSRISDLLNAKELHYIPVTEVVFRKIRHPDEPPRHADTVILKLDTVKMVVPLDRQQPSEV